MPEMMKDIKTGNEVLTEVTDGGFNLIVDGKKHFVQNAVYGPKQRNIQQMGDFYP